MREFFLRKKKGFFIFCVVFCVSILCVILIFYGKQYLQELLSAKNIQEKIIEDVALVADTVTLTYIKDSGESLLYHATQTQTEDGTGIIYASFPSLTYQFSDKSTFFEIKSSFGSFDQKDKVMLFSGNVQIQSRDIVIYSEQAQLLIEKDMLIFQEGALVERANSSLKANTLEWNVKTNALNATVLRIIYVRGKNEESGI
ncbi:MAG: LPS export ABC transporter periplasmic protein LptC [Desulfovibrionaceae bacterium]